MPAFSKKGLVFAGKDSIFNLNNLKEELSQEVVDDFISATEAHLFEYVVGFLILLVH
jgi:hypothetical protein